MAQLKWPARGTARHHASHGKASPRDRLRDAAGEVINREEWIYSSDPKRAAAAWHALIGSEPLSDHDRGAFVDWLRKSPVHLSEYLRLEAVRGQLRDPVAFEGLSIEALQTQIASNVQMLPRTDPSLSLPHRHQCHWIKLGMAASFVVCLIVVLVWQGSSEWPMRITKTEYATAIGEQRSIVFPDGSIAELNTRSRLEVRYSSAAREVTLEEGEALFRVAKDAARPFRVLSGATVAQAVGTEFTVRRDVDRTTVTVLEGHVLVAPAGPITRNVALGAGQQVAIAAGERAKPIAIRTVNPQIVTAWKARRLVFDDLPLQAVLAEFNRYNVRQILLEGDGLSARRTTGVFNASDPDSFLSFLKGAEGIRVTKDTDGNLLIHPAESF